MSNIINEIEKLNLFNNGDKLDWNEYNVFYNNRHTKTWNLIDSIGKKDLNKSIKIYKNLLLNGVSLVPIIINFTTFYLELLSNENNQYNGLNKIINSRMNKYRNLYKSSEILNIIIALRNLDILIKSTNIKDDILFTPVIFKICKGYYV
jgi:DNA polymerase III delta subunit